jgi:two-component system phosphate regulon response regulator PhoB
MSEVLKTILIVDDDPMLLELLSRKLKVKGYTVKTANDGQSGLARAREEPPDLVILDDMMPVLDGRQVLREMKADERLARIPTIMLTARRGEADVVTSLRLGANDHIGKPFRPDELVARVERLLPNNDTKSA